MLFASLSAQRIVPGYLGKKNIGYIGGQLNVLSAYNYVVDLQNSNPIYNKNFLGYSLGLQRVIGRNGMMGIAFSYHKSDVFSAQSSVYEESVYSGFQATLQFRSYYYKSKGSIAPLGSHMRYNISVESNSLNTSHMNTLIGKTVDIGLGLGSGKSRVFLDKLWVDYGFEFNYFFNVYNQQDVVKGFEYTAQVRNNINTMYLVSFKANFGYLF